MTRTIIFDLDGTLLDTLADLTAAVNYALHRQGYPPRTPEEVRTYLGNGAGRLIECAAPLGCKDINIDTAFADFKAHYMQHCMDQTHPYTGIPDMLQRLRQLGYATAIVSNKLQDGVTQLWRRFFADFVEVAIGELPPLRRKPEPDMLLEAMRRLGATPDTTIYVGDSEVDIATARAAGLPCISVEWGFRSAEALRQAGATRIVSSAEELFNAITQ